MTQGNDENKAGVIAKIVLGAVIAVVAGVILLPQFSGRDISVAEIEDEGEWGDEAVVIDVNADEVQAAMGPFLMERSDLVLSRVNSMYAEDGLAGKVDNGMMLEMALTMVEYGECKMPKEKIEERYGGATEEAEQLYGVGCLDAEKARDIMRELFGVEKMAMGAVGYNNMLKYSVDYDEFYVAAAEFEEIFAVFMHNLERAEQKGDSIRVYERVGVDDGGVGEIRDMGCYAVDRGDCPVTVNLEMQWNTDDEEGAYDAKASEMFLANSEKFTEYRWTLKKGAEGGYVFAGLKDM